jgi:thioredoxin-related protein
LPKDVKTLQMHKIIIGLFLVMISGTTLAQEIKWMSMNAALKAQKKEPKKIFMDAYTTWCGPCKMLDRNTFTNHDVINYINKHYYPVKFNAEGNEEIKYQEKTFTNPGFDPNRKGRNSQHQFATAMKITGYPSLVFFDEKANLIGPIPGYRHELELFLKLFLKEDYKRINTSEAFEEYSKNFTNKFVVSGNR